MDRIGFNKQETLAQIDALLLEKGPRLVYPVIPFSVPMIKHECYSIVMPIREVMLFFTVGENAIDERARRRDKTIDKIVRTVEGQGLIHPNITAATWEMCSPSLCSVIKHSGGPFDLLVIDLREYRESLAAIDDVDGDFPDGFARLGILVDGVQRVLGIASSLKKKGSWGGFEMVVQLYPGLANSTIYKLFCALHGGEKETPFAQRILNKYMAGILDKGKSETFELELFADRNSPVFSNRIKWADDVTQQKVRPLITGEKLFDYLVKWRKDCVRLGLGGRISNVDDSLNLLDCYFEAWRACWPMAWSDGRVSSKYLLTKGAGLHILFRLFPQITSILLRKGLGLDTVSYVQVLKDAFFEKDGVTPCYIMLQPGNVMVRLDWSSSAFGKYSSGGGVAKLFNSIVSQIDMEEGGGQA